MLKSPSAGSSKLVVPENLTHFTVRLAAEGVKYGPVDVAAGGPVPVAVLLGTQLTGRADENLAFGVQGKIPVKMQIRSDRAGVVKVEYLPQPSHEQDWEPSLQLLVRLEGPAVAPCDGRSDDAAFPLTLHLRFDATDAGLLQPLGQNEMGFKIVGNYRSDVVDSFAAAIGGGGV